MSAPPEVYIAGPLFTPGQRALLEAIDALCRAEGLATYLPHRDAGVFDREGDSRPFFLGDVRALQRAVLVIAVLNGCDVDSGTAWELGYAYALGRPVLGLLNDVRIARPQAQLNPMVWNTLAGLATDLDTLRSLLRDLVARGLPLPGDAPPASPSDGGAP